MKISRYLDMAVLKPQMNEEEIKDAILLGISEDVYSVCVRPCDIELAARLCQGTNTKVSCVLDFPHGDSSAEGKRALAAIYAEMGVAEIDMVMNYGYARSGKWAEIEEGIRGVVEAAASCNVDVKVILETCNLTEEEITEAVKTSIRAGAAYVKTSTGFASGGASEQAVRAMVQASEGKIKVKASGGIRDYKTARQYVEMGAERLGVGYGSTREICDGER